MFAKLIATMGDFAAWKPVVDNYYKVGDYGYIDKHGLFRRESNIEKEFSISCGSQSGKSAAIEKSLSGWRATEITPAGQANIPQASSSMSASMTIKFAGEECWMIKTRDKLSVEILQDLPRIARQACADKRFDRHRMFIVSKVYSAEAPVIIGSHGKNFEISFHGAVSVLQQLRAGSGSLGLTFTGGTSETFVQVSEDTGPISLELVQVKKSRRKKRVRMKYVDPKIKSVAALDARTGGIGVSEDGDDYQFAEGDEVDEYVYEAEVVHPKC